MLGPIERLLLLAALATSAAGYQGNSPIASGARHLTSSCPRLCEARGSSKITVDCDYLAGTIDRSDNQPRIVFNHAVITFGPQDESQMRVELTFRNVGNKGFAEKRTVYVEFDDETGKNYIRRALTDVDLLEVEPGQTKTFSDTFLTGALPPSRYIVRLWIPSQDPSREFDSSQNFVLSNPIVRETETRLNRIAVVTVNR